MRDKGVYNSQAAKAGFADPKDINFQELQAVTGKQDSDFLIVDEASMIDVGHMLRLLEKYPFGWQIVRRSPML